LDRIAPGLKPAPSRPGSGKSRVRSGKQSTKSSSRIAGPSNLLPQEAFLWLKMHSDRFWMALLLRNLLGHVQYNLKVNLDICKALLNTNAFSKALAHQFSQHGFACKQATPALLPSHRASPPFGWYWYSEQ